MKRLILIILILSFSKIIKDIKFKNKNLEQALVAAINNNDIKSYRVDG